MSRQSSLPAGLSGCGRSFGSPGREVIELLARADDVDRWAEEQGHPLVFWTDSIPEHAWPEDAGPTEEGEAVEWFAEHAGSVLRSFDTVVGFWESDQQGDLEAIRSDEDRRGICSLLILSRGALIWARGNEPELEPAAVATVFASQALFIASREDPPNGDLFPSREFVRELVEAADAARCCSRTM